VTLRYTSHLETPPPGRNTVYRRIYCDIPSCAILGELVRCYGISSLRPDRVSRYILVYTFARKYVRVCTSMYNLRKVYTRMYRNGYVRTMHCTYARSSHRHGHGGRLQESNATVEVHALFRELNAILENNLVPSHGGKGQLRILGCIEWD
jgi:hypothetical protein